MTSILNESEVHSRRFTCRLCGSGRVKISVPLRPVPVGEKYLDNRSLGLEQRFPIDLYQCQDCRAVQTQDDIASQYLWTGYTYFSGQTKGILNHFKNFVDRLSERIDLSHDKTVIDIGSNDGSLLQFFKDRGCSVYGIDPAEEVASVAEKQGIPTYVGLFDDRVIEHFRGAFQSADVITAFNVFAHSPDMQGMIAGVKKLLNPNGLFCFEVQYLGAIVDKKLLGTVFHEHMIHYSATSAAAFLKKNGFRLVDVERNTIQMGSVIFYAAHEGSGHTVQPSVADMLEKEVEDGLIGDEWSRDFRGYIDQMRRHAEVLSSSYKKDQLTVVGFGAARSGPTFAIQYGLENLMQFLLDDHPSKCHKYGAFEGLLVKPTSTLSDEHIDVAVILAWIHAKTIVSNHRQYLERGGRFLVLWPEVQEVTSTNVDEWLGRFKSARK